MDNTNTSPGSSSNVSPTKPQQQSEAYGYPKHEIGFGNSHSVPVPLYSQDIWSGQSDNPAGQFLGSNNLNALSLTRNSNPILDAYAGFQSHEVAEKSGMYSNINWYQSSGILNMGNQCSFGNESMLGSSNIAQMAMTQSGSQNLLDSLLKKDPRVTTKIFEGVYNFLFEVMNDSNGHHLFAKLILSCSDNQLHRIVAMIALNVRLLINTSVSRYGSKSVQRLIKVLEKSPLIDIVIAALSSGFEELMTNRSGSLVILKCLNLNNEKNQKLYETAINHCIPLAQNEKGCIYLNEFITNSKTPYREKLIAAISSKSKFLSQDPSGNFVVQHILGLHNPNFSERICLELRDLYVQLSLQKGGSHVVEKCLNSSGMVHVVTVLLEYEKLCQVARDQYGNYVIQTALKSTKRAKSPLHQMLVSKLLKNPNELMFGFGKKVLGLIHNGIPLE
ncbi:pumilio homolog 12-like [Argentina anserina]|uniref:pumilio homolog 12-like n=1 Tax=Argentina anserina TaxID=57926 RepID=UPI002176800D|nr:pumilio homolog 12-like [Potentilla anserina]